MTLHVHIYDDADDTHEDVEIPDDDYLVLTSGECKMAWGGTIPWESMLPGPSPLPLPLVPDLHLLIISGRRPPK